MVATVLVISDMLRWENAESVYEKERSSAEVWNARYRTLYQESVRTNAVLSHMTDGIVMLSPSTEILLVNESARRLLAIPTGGACLGRKLAELVRIPEIVHATQRTRTDRLDQHVSVEIVDPRTISPLDVDTILESVAKTGRLLIADESFAPFGVGAEIAARVVDLGFDDLDAPIRRLNGLHTPTPYSPSLEKTVVPQVEDVIAAIQDLLEE